MKSSLILASSSLCCKFHVSASTGCWREVSQFPAGRVPALDFALVRALFFLLQHKPFLGDFLYQEWREYSLRGDTLIIFAQKSTSKHFPMFLYFWEI